VLHDDSNPTQSTGSWAHVGTRRVQRSLPDNPPRKYERIANGDTVDHGNNIGWAVEFIVGSAWRYTKDQEFYVRCARYAD
jgi:hypothetical protein